MNKKLIGLAALVGAMMVTPATAGASAEHARRGPTVRITSPGNRSVVAPGDGIPGHGSPDGSGFALNIEVDTHDAVGIRVKEALNIRHTDALGFPNPDFPGLDVTIDNDLTKPDGGIIPAGTNLASLFNIAGTDDRQGPGVTVWAGWHVLESLAPGTRRITIRVAVTDEAGRTGTTMKSMRVSDTAGSSGQALTPPPGAVSDAAADDDDGSGPAVSIEAPQPPTSVAVGTLPQPTLANGTLFFIQVDATDRAGHGIGVNENGSGSGLIVDPTQIRAHGPNRNYPGLDVTFDVALLQPNGNLIPAGQNLAPLFNIAGSELTRRGGSSDRAAAVRTVADWVIGGSLVFPEGQSTLTITATVTDNAGKTGHSTVTVGMSPATSGQDLTPAP